MVGELTRNIFLRVVNDDVRRTAWVAASPWSSTSPGYFDTSSSRSHLMGMDASELALLAPASTQKPAGNFFISVVLPLSRLRLAPILDASTGIRSIIGCRRCSLKLRATGSVGSTYMPGPGAWSIT